MRPVGPEYKNLSWVWGADQRSPFGIMRLCLEMPNSDPEGRIFLFVPNNHDRFIFLHAFWSPVFDFNVEVTINKSLSYYLTSATLKVDVVCDVTMTSTPNVLTTELHDLLYNQCIDNSPDMLSNPKIGDQFRKNSSGDTTQFFIKKIMKIWNSPYYGQKFLKSYVYVYKQLVQGSLQKSWYRLAPDLFILCLPR